MAFRIASEISDLSKAYFLKFILHKISYFLYDMSRFQCFPDEKLGNTKRCCLKVIVYAISSI